MSGYSRANRAMCVEAMTLNRRATDRGEPTNREILTALNAFIKEHQAEHKDLETRLGLKSTAQALDRSDIDALQLMAVDIKALHDFRVQVETIGASVKWILGGSLLAALASIMALVTTLGHIIQAGP